MSGKKVCKQKDLTEIPKREPVAAPSLETVRIHVLMAGQEFCFPCYAQLMKKG